MEWMLLWLMLSFVPAGLAGRKGYSVVIYFILSMIFSPLIGFLVILFAEDRTRTPCPFCRERINPEATRCPKCQADLAAAGYRAVDVKAKPRR